MRKTKSPNRTGLTLVELVVALAAAVMVIFATAIMLVAGEKSWDRSMQLANLRRDAANAMLEMKRAMRSGSLAELDTDDEGVTIHTPGGWVHYWFDPGTNDLIYQLEGGDPQMLLDGTAQSVDFELAGTANNAVSVKIQLQDGDCQVQFSTTTMMRNHVAGT